MNREHVAIGYRAMDRAVPSSFDLGVWVSEAIKENINTVEDLHECGSVACAAGFLGLSKEFQEKGGTTSVLGIPIYESGHGEDALIRFYETGHPDSDASEIILLMHGLYHDEEEILDFYGIDYDPNKMNELKQITPDLVRKQFAILFFILQVTS